MTKYFVISPYDSTKPRVYDQVWNYDLQTGTIAVGWIGLNEDVADLDRTELRELLREVFEYPNESTLSRECNELYRFYHEIDVGDVILPDERGAIEYHGFLIHYLARALTNEIIEFEPYYSFRPRPLYYQSSRKQLFSTFLSIL